MFPASHPMILISRQPYYGQDTLLTMPRSAYYAAHEKAKGGAQIAQHSADIPHSSPEHACTLQYQN